MTLLFNQGSRVVLREDTGQTSSQPAFKHGMVGMVIKVPEDAHDTSYRVRFPDGGVGAFHQDQLISLAAWKSDEGASPDLDLNSYVIYNCVVGSRAFGLSHEGSDTDTRGIFLPPAHVHWSLWGVPEQLEDKENESCFWELEKFLRLALRANPNILECLYTPLVLHCDEIAQRLLDMRHIFLSKSAYQTYNGYVLSQFKKMTNRRDRIGEINWKHAMHLIRLLYAGIGLLEDHRVMVDVGEHRDTLLAVKSGDYGWNRLEALRLQLHQRFEDAYRTTTLPERPDYNRANTFLLEARRAMVKE